MKNNLKEFAKVAEELAEKGMTVVPVSKRDAYVSALFHLGLNPMGGALLLPSEWQGTEMGVVLYIE